MVNWGWLALFSVFLKVSENSNNSSVVKYYYFVVIHFTFQFIPVFKVDA